MVDVIIVQKKTDHKTHHDTRVRLQKHLNSLGLTHKILTLDDIQNQNIPYFDSEQKNSGFHPKKSLVISLGGDGTLLHASHYVGGAVRLLGVNSIPENSIGYLCALKPDDIEKKLELFGTNEKSFKSVQRIKVNFVDHAGVHMTKQQNPLPLCLNDVLICHKHPAATTRCVFVTTNIKTGHTERSQMTFSSGIWISTAAGQTAAISAYQFPKVDDESDTLFVAIREPYLPRGAEPYKSCFSFLSGETQLSIASHMQQGLVCVDGPDSCADFGFADSVVFSTPKEGVLRLVL